MLIRANEDKDIKVALVEHLLDSICPSEIIGCEVPYFFGRRRADIVLIGNDLQAFEIKGDFDDLKKLPDQISSYTKSFDFVTVVATQRHVKKVSAALPKKIGLYLYDEGKFKKLRASKRIGQKNKAALASVLSKAEALAAARQFKVNIEAGKRALVDEVRNALAKSCSENQLRALAIEHFRNRYSDSFKLFLSDKGDRVHVDDLRTLACIISTIK